MQQERADEMVTIRLPRHLFDRMVGHCRSEYPHEACGLLSGSGETAARIYEMPNADRSPVSYLVDTGAQFRAMKEMREKGERMVAIYHSHPQSAPYPSQKDIRLAFYSDAVYIIIGLAGDELPDARAYTIVDGEVGEAGMEIVS